MINDKPMGRRTYWRMFVLLAAMITLAAVLAFSVIREKTTCMQVPILRESDYAKFTVYEPIDLSPWIYQNDENAAIDTYTSTIYISQNISADTHLADLVGILEIQRSDYQLYFAPDEMFRNLKAAVETGHTFKLLAVQNEGTYMSYNVIFTTMPILRMNGVETSVFDEEGRPITEGNLCLWTSSDPEVERYTVKSSQVQWHIRGATSQRMEKKSWKITLKDENGENKDVSFLNMGKDDDWVLNSMSLDDLKIREKVAIDMWNQYICTNHAGYPMSTANYVEVVCNNRYQGLYLLQRRVDAKYLSLDRNKDLLFKCLSTYEKLGLRVNYEVKYSPFDDDKTYTILENTLSYRDGCKINLDSFIDTVLFIQYFALMDNQGFKNMYYILREEDEGYSMYFSPWDTDMAMGLTWTSFFEYNYDATVNISCSRREWGYVLSDVSDLDSLVAQQWKEFREHAFSEEVTYSLIDDNRATVELSGAYNRDIQRWGLFYGGEDSYDTVRQWCSERWIYLDDIYGA